MTHIQGCEVLAFTAESAQQSGPCDNPEEQHSLRQYNYVCRRCLPGEVRKRAAVYHWYDMGDAIPNVHHQPCHETCTQTERGIRDDASQV